MHLSTSTTTTPQQGEDPAKPATPGTPRRSRSPSRRGENHTATTTGGGQQTPSPVHRARSQASQLMASITSETQAAAEYAPNAEGLGGKTRGRSGRGAGPYHGSNGDGQRRGDAGGRRLSLSRSHQTIAARGRPLPTPNAFEIAALTVGIMEESAQQGEPPSMAELLELLELVQAGMALLTRGRHSYNWQVTHWATDAAEEALVLLTVATATDHVGELQQAQPDVGDALPRLRNLLDEAATGVGVLVGIYPHRGEEEQVHPADAIAQQEDRHQQVQHPRRDPPDALHIYKAQRHLRQLVPFLDGDMRDLGDKALTHLGDWIRSHWGTPQYRRRSKPTRARTSCTASSPRGRGEPKPRGGPIRKRGGS